MVRITRGSVASAFVIMVAVLAVTMSTAGAGAGAAGWRVVPSANSGSHGSVLQDVAAASTTDAWTVGYRLTRGGVQYQTLTEHWDGVSWAVVPSPDVNPTGDSLEAVAIVSANDVWAVGHSSIEGTTSYQTLIEHWNGSAWRIVSSPNPSNFATLNGVVALGPNDVWAVGHDAGPNQQEQTLILHWTGTKWHVVKSPNAAGGSNLLNSVTAVSATDLWAVGAIGTAKTLTLHSDGTAWKIVASPNPGSGANEFYSVSGLASDDVWAVGYDSPARAVLAPIVAHWDGTQWNIVATPNPSGYKSVLFGVTAITSTDAWAVGYANFGGQTLIEHWDGIAWAIAPSPSPGTSSNALYGVAAVPATNRAWSVGYRGNAGPLQTLTESYR